MATTATTALLAGEMWECGDGTITLSIKDGRLYVHAQFDATDDDWEECWDTSDRLTVPGELITEQNIRAGIETYSMVLAS